MIYAVEPRRVPSTGEPIFDRSTGSIAESDSPAREVVLMELRSTRGLCLVDPEQGVDWRALRKVTTGLAATARDLILAALTRHVRSGLIARLSVETQADAARGGLLFSVSFFDPRLGRTVTLPGRL